MKKILIIFCCVLFSSLSYAMHKKSKPHISKKETIKTLEIILNANNIKVITIQDKLIKNTQDNLYIRHLLEKIKKYKKL